MAIVLMLMSSVAAMACEAYGDPGSHRKPAPVPAPPLDSRPPRDPHFDAPCEPRQYCARLDLEDDTEAFRAKIALIDCTVHRSAFLSGSWGVEDPRVYFEWQAEVPVDAVFPTLDQVVAYRGCAQARPQVHSPVALIARNPDGLDWAEVEENDVFIPLSGKATIDHAFVATAGLEATDGGAPLHVTVSIQGPQPALTAQYRDLARGDDFHWGDHRATIARIVRPQTGELGVIGWIEIELSGTP
jgi:hypothetical protein